MAEFSTQSGPASAPPPTGRIEGPRKPRWRALRRLYMTVRTEHTSPARMAAAVALGVFIGCSPLWGAHLALCVVFASLFRLNRLLVYAAANLANPFTAVPLVVLEIQVGYRILHGGWLELALPATLEGAIDLGRLAFLSWLLGSAIVGLALGGGLGALTWLVSRAGRLSESFHHLVDRVALRYLSVSIRDAEAARSSLLRNPVWGFLLEEPAFASAERILDLGCGRALPAALALEGLPVRAAGRSYLGVDVSERYIRVARQVYEDVPGHAFVAADLRDFDPPDADLVLLLNVLHDLPVPAQDALLRRLGKALSPGARVIVREIDAGKGWIARLALAREALSLLLPGRARYGIHARRASDLKNALVATGFDVRDRTTPRAASRARVLLEAVRRPTAAPRAGLP